MLAYASVRAHARAGGCMSVFGCKRECVVYLCVYILALCLIACMSTCVSEGERDSGV